MDVAVVVCFEHTRQESTRSPVWRTFFRSNGSLGLVRRWTTLRVRTHWGGGAEEPVPSDATARHVTVVFTAWVGHNWFVRVCTQTHWMQHGLSRLTARALPAPWIPKPFQCGRGEALPLNGPVGILPWSAPHNVDGHLHREATCWLRRCAPAQIWVTFRIQQPNHCPAQTVHTLNRVEPQRQRPFQMLLMWRQTSTRNLVCKNMS